MSVRVSPTEKIRAEIDALFDGERELGEVIEDVARLGARLIIQTAIEAEVTAYLGRDRYERAATSEDVRAGMRNGYCPTTVKTTAGPVTLARPKVRGTTERFASQLFGKGVTKTNALESLVIAGFVRGLSVRDVEATLAEALAVRPPRCRNRRCRGCVRRSRPSSRRGRRGVSTTWSWTTCSWTGRTSSTTRTRRPSRYWPRGASTPTANRCSSGWTRPPASPTTRGKGSSTGLGERGLACPLLVISDGAAGLIGAVERTMGAALRQRCLVHRARNVLAKVPKNAQTEVKADYWAIFDVPDKIEPGLDAVTYVQKRIDAFEKRWRDSYPAAVRCLLDDRDSLTVYLRCPREHWTRVRHSNFIERTFGETRRRVKVIGRLPGEHSCLKLVWAVLDRASTGWRGFTMTPAGLRLLADLRRSLHDPPTPIRRTSQPAAQPEEAVGAVA